MKYLLAIAALLTLTGCDTTIDDCRSKGYKGIVTYTDVTAPGIFCSNGTLTPDKKGYITTSGVKSMDLAAEYIPLPIKEIK